MTILSSCGGQAACALGMLGLQRGHGEMLRVHGDHQ